MTLNSNVELNPGEESRTYSSTYSSDFAYSFLDSSMCWLPSYLSVPAGDSTESSDRSNFMVIDAGS